MREYSIPHLRRGGRISIPEESFDRIRKARDLHREGLGTGSVRRALREEAAAPDTAEIEHRLDRLSATLEDLRGSIRDRRPATTDPLPSHTLRTIMARQNLLMSAVFSLTEMVEDLLLATGKPRKPTFDLGEDPPVGNPISGNAPPPLPSGSRTANAVASPHPARGLPAPSGPGRFGTLGRRRRRVALATLCVVLLAGLLAWAIPTLGGELLSAQHSGDPDVSQAAAQKPSAGNAGAPDKTSAGADAGSERSSVAKPETPGEKATSPGEVPDVSGESMQEAARALTGAGYIVAGMRVVSGPEPAGTVVSTDPKPGKEAEPGTPVVLVLSGGPGNPSSADGGDTSGQYAD